MNIYADDFSPPTTPPYARAARMLRVRLLRCAPFAAIYAYAAIFHIDAAPLRLLI